MQVHISRRLELCMTEAPLFCHKGDWTYLNVSALLALTFIAQASLSQYTHLITVAQLQLLGAEMRS